MRASASVLTAATTLVEWAHQRRRHWTDEPLRVEPRTHIVESQPIEPIEETVEETPAFLTEHIEAHNVTPLPHFSEAFESSEVPEVSFVPELPEIHDHVLEVQAMAQVAHVSHDVEYSAPLAELPVEPPVEITPASLFESTEIHAAVAEPEPFAEPHRSAWSGVGRGAFGVLRASGSSALAIGKLILSAGGKVGDAATVVFDGVGPWSDIALWCLTRGAAIVSTASVLMLLTLHRADLFSRWNRLTETVAAAAAATRPQPPPPIVFPAGSGRLIITSSDENPQVIIDGKAFGPAPVKLFLPAGAHRLLVRGPKGSVERTIHVEAGETAELNEEIYPGWVAVASAVDLTFSENGRTLKRDERGWAILPPGPHDIHLDNNLLGIHETRHVVITPGDAARISLAPPASTLSIAASEPAEVWVDGTSLGEAPIVDAPMKLGMHDVRVRSASHERWLRVRVTTQPAELNVNLAE